MARLGLDGLAQPADRPSAGVDDLPADPGALDRDHHLPGRPLGRDEHRAQAFMACHHVAQRGAHGVGVQRPAQPQGDGHVVHRRRTVQLVEEPQAGLRERQRHHGRPLGRDDPRERASPAAHPRRQLGDRGRLEQGPHPEVGVEAGVDRGDQPHRGQRVAAEVEEGVVDPDAFDAEDPGEDAGQDFLDGAFRGAISVAALVVRGGQGAGVELAVDRHRQRVERHDRRRDHVRGEPPTQPGPNIGRVSGSCHIADETLLAGTIFTDEHRRVFNALHLEQRGADLAQFDAIPTHLNLFIGAAQILQLPLPGSGAAPADQVAGAVHAGAGFAERAGHEPRRGQPGTPPIADTDTFAGQVQLPDHPGGHRAQPLVEHEERRPAHRGADRREARPRRQGRALARPHRGLGRAVHVDHHPTRRPAVHQLRRAGLGADHQRRGVQAVGGQQPHRRGGLGQHRDALAHQQGVELLG